MHCFVHAHVICFCEVQVNNVPWSHPSCRMQDQNINPGLPGSRVWALKHTETISHSHKEFMKLFDFTSCIYRKNWARHDLPSWVKRVWLVLFFMISKLWMGLEVIPFSSISCSTIQIHVTWDRIGVLLDSQSYEWLKGITLFWILFSGNNIRLF